MVRKTLADACLVVEALGPKSRELFIADFVENHPREYKGFYNHQSRGRDEDKVGRKGRGGAPRRPPSKRDNLGKDTAGNDGVTLATLMGWNTMQAAARDQCFDAFDDGRDAADVPSSSTSSPIRRSRAAAAAAAEGRPTCESDRPLRRRRFRQVSPDQ